MEDVGIHTEIEAAEFGTGQFDLTRRCQSSGAQRQGKVQRGLAQHRFPLWAEHTETEISVQLEQAADEVDSVFCGILGILVKLTGNLSAIPPNGLVSEKYEAGVP